MRLTLVGKKKKICTNNKNWQGEKKKLENLQFGFWLGFSAELRRIQTV